MGGNKRQRLARRKFVAATGGDGPKQTPILNAVEENGSKPGKKKVLAKKRKLAESDARNGLGHHGVVAGPEFGAMESEENGPPTNDQSISSETKVLGENGAQKKIEKVTGSKKQGSKHPLRIPGSKPGEGCFICKGTDHIAKLCPTKCTRDRKKICLLCRTIGHTLKNCPTSFESQDAKFCYNCGENGHRLAKCKKPLKDGGTTFAECFVCKKKGHLSKSCPTNPHGIYPKGGCCKLCQGVTHLAKDCTTKKTGGRVQLQISTAVAQASEPGGGGKRTVFRSGDDLGDDFVSDDEGGNTIIGALSFGSDDEVPEISNETRPVKNSIKPKHRKVVSGMAKVIPESTGSNKLQPRTKVIKFQRPQ